MTNANNPLRIKMAPPPWTFEYSLLMENRSVHARIGGESRSTQTSKCSEMDAWAAITAGGGDEAVETYRALAWVMPSQCCGLPAMTTSAVHLETDVSGLA